MLVVPGVVADGVRHRLGRCVLFGLPLSSGLLIGAALSPTDPAILVPLFERIRVRPKVSQTIIAESALNDPTGAVLALAFAGVVLSGSASADRADGRLRQATSRISTAMGVVFGLVLSAAVSSRRAGIWGESAAIAVLAVVAGGFFSIDSAGGSGYLGAFLAGLIVGNMDRLGLAMHSHHESEMRVARRERSPTSMVMLVFITLGANIPWTTIADEFGAGARGPRHPRARRPPAGRARLPARRPPRAMDAPGDRLPRAGRARRASCPPRSPG